MKQLNDNVFISIDFTAEYLKQTLVIHKYDQIVDQWTAETSVSYNTNSYYSHANLAVDRTNNCFYIYDEDNGKLYRINSELNSVEVDGSIIVMANRYEE